MPTLKYCKLLSEVSTYAWLGMYYFNVKDFIFLFWVVFTELLAEFLHAFAIPFTYFKILLNFYRSTSHLTNRNDMAKLFEIVYTSIVLISANPIKYANEGKYYK